jgi:hypothetical protein
MSAVKGAVAPVVTKHSFDSEDQFHDLAIFVPDLEDPRRNLRVATQSSPRFCQHPGPDVRRQGAGRRSLGHNRLTLARGTDALSSRQGPGGGAIPRKVHEAITHIPQHGVSNTEAAAAVAALSVLNTIPLDTKIHSPMAAATVHNAQPVRQRGTRRRWTP